MPEFVIEHVPYYRYVASYVVSSGKRRRKVLHAPAHPYAREAFAKFVYYEGVDIKPKSNVRIWLEPLH